MNNLLSRLLTAVVAVPLLLGMLYKLPWFGWGSFVAIALVIASLEFFAFSHREDKLGRMIGLAMTVAIYALLLWTDFGSLPGSAFAVIAALGAIVPVALIYTLFRPMDQSTALLRMATMTLAPMYLAVGFATNSALGRVHETGSRHIGAGLVVFSLMVSWFSDTAGYFAGKTIGGPKLYAAVSPNKTWAGSIGGLGGSAIGALLAHYWYLPEMPLGKGLFAAVLAGALGQIGDLCESLMKRSAGVKDSGGILPGHGGILDRVDALLFVSLTLYGLQRIGWLIP